jgi:hypothetical protein
MIYFGIDDWRSTANFPTSAIPGGIGSVVLDNTLALPVTTAQYQYNTRLYNGEINLRPQWNDWLTPLLGFRWLDLEDRLQATGTDAIFSENYTQLVRAHNHLYGYQMGVDARLVEWQGLFRINAVAKVGIYDDAMLQSNRIASAAVNLSSRATTDHAAFLGELGLIASYQLTPHLAARGGYQLMWIDGVALAPQQISATNFSTATASVNTSGCLFCQGANVGLELSW